MNSKSVLNRQYKIESPLSSANVQPSKLISLGKRIWQSLAHYLLRGNEPQVWQVRDASGNIGWRAYDPVSRQKLVCSSQQEVRIWLEQLHYQ